MWGLKNDSTNDRSTSPLEEQVFGVIPLVPLFNRFFLIHFILCTEVVVLRMEVLSSSPFKSIYSSSLQVTVPSSKTCKSE
jgi:hypothetical protein